MPIWPIKGKSQLQTGNDNFTCTSEFDQLQLFHGTLAYVINGIGVQTIQNGYLHLEVSILAMSDCENEGDSGCISATMWFDYVFKLMFKMKNENEFIFLFTSKQPLNESAKNEKLFRRDAIQYNCGRTSNLLPVLRGSMYMLVMFGRGACLIAFMPCHAMDY